MAPKEIILDFSHLLDLPIRISEDIYFINLHYFLKNNEPISLIDNHLINYSTLTYNKTNVALYYGFMAYLKDGYRLSSNEIRLLRSYIANFFLKFQNLKSKDWIESPVQNYSSATLHAVRYGNVELRVIENYLYDRKSLIDTVRIISHEINSGQFNLRNQIKDVDKWFTASDIRFNLQALMTNAGYIVSKNPDSAEKDLLDWCRLYFEEIEASSSFVHPGAYPFFLGTLQKIFDNPAGDFHNVRFPNTKNFYEILKGKKILFLTPFAKLIQENFNKGNIFSLYRDVVLPEFELITMDSPLSLYPSRPYESWSNAHNAACKKIDELIIKCNIDMFIASAGSYGLPLCNHVRKKYPIHTLYFGNHLNTLFGVLQQCSENFMDGFRRDESWVRGDLSDRCPHIIHIDKGRYV